MSPSTEPVLTAATISGVIIALLSVFKVGVDASAVETVVAAVLPLILAVIARSKVSPVK